MRASAKWIILGIGPHWLRERRKNRRNSKGERILAAAASVVSRKNKPATP
jgi:hypothetical protein